VYDIPMGIFLCRCPLHLMMISSVGTSICSSMGTVRKKMITLGWVVCSTCSMVRKKKMTLGWVVCGSSSMV
jgi:hypothetical protein